MRTRLPPTRSKPFAEARWQEGGGDAVDGVCPVFQDELELNQNGEGAKGCSEHLLR